MTRCPKCGGEDWNGPKYIGYHVDHVGASDLGWPTVQGTMVPCGDALMYRCATCGFPRFARTVAYGGEPVPKPAPKASRKKKDAGA